MKSEQIMLPISESEAKINHALPRSRLCPGADDDDPEIDDRTCLANEQGWVPLSRFI
jgi:hypothetical protein